MTKEEDEGFPNEYFELLNWAQDAYGKRLNNGTWKPANSPMSRKEKQETLMGMIGKTIDSKLADHLKEFKQPPGDRVKCFKCGGNHYKRDCPQLKDNENSWRYENPKQGEELVKTVKGKEYTFCSKCRRGKGYWTDGSRRHSTEEHVVGFRPKKEENTDEDTRATTPAGGATNSNPVNTPSEEGGQAHLGLRTSPFDFIDSDFTVGGQC